MLNISKNRCIGCGICESDCPVGAVKVNKEKGIAVIDQNNCINCRVCLQNCPQDAIKDIKQSLLFAIGTDDNKNVKQGDHVGMSKLFQIWKYSNGDLKFIEKRENAKYKEDEERPHGDPGKAKAISSALRGIDVLVGKIIGPNITRLRKHFVCAVIREPEIEKGIEIIKENINEIIEEKNKQERKAIILK